MGNVTLVNNIITEVLKFEKLILDYGFGLFFRSV